MGGVLLLNSSFEPLRICTIHRAIVLVYQGKAEVLEESDQVFSSANAQIKVPKVIRLKYFVNLPYKTRMPINRQAILARDNHECQFVGCNRKGTTIDHVLPRSKGGKHEWTNVVASCAKCNAKKSDKLLEHLGWKLKSQPTQPSSKGWALKTLHRDPVWEPYLEAFSA